MHYSQNIAAKLHRALWGLVGPDGMDDLDTMEAAIRLLPAPEEDKACALDAIHALRAAGDKPTGDTPTTVSGSPSCDRCQGFPAEHIGQGFYLCVDCLKRPDAPVSR